MALPYNAEESVTNQHAQVEVAASAREAAEEVTSAHPENVSKNNEDLNADAEKATAHA